MYHFYEGSSNTDAHSTAQDFSEGRDRIRDCFFQDLTARASYGNHNVDHQLKLFTRIVRNEGGPQEKLFLTLVMISN